MEQPGRRGIGQFDAALREILLARRWALAIGLGAPVLAGLLLLGLGRAATPSRALATAERTPYIQLVPSPMIAARPLD